MGFAMAANSSAAVLYRYTTDAAAYEAEPGGATAVTVYLEEMLADGDKVIVTGHLNLTAKSTDRTIDSDFVHVITLNGGKWMRFRDFMNTAVAVQAFS